MVNFVLLYLIPFLHQTTTFLSFYFKKRCCILFHFYIKPQPRSAASEDGFSCILFHFYIKPQLLLILLWMFFGCILFHFYIKPQPRQCLSLPCSCCILFHFYIKPQPMAHKTLFSSTLSPKSHSHFQRNAVV